MKDSSFHQIKISLDNSQLGIQVSTFFQSAHVTLNQLNQKMSSDHINSEIACLDRDNAAGYDASFNFTECQRVLYHQQSDSIQSKIAHPLGILTDNLANFECFH